MTWLSSSITTVYHELSRKLLDVWYMPYYDSPMNPLEERFLELLNTRDPATVGTSIRIPVALRDAAALATSLGLTASLTEVTVDALRNRLEVIGMRMALDDEYREHPELRPSLAEVALAAAELDGNPIAARVDLLERAAADLAATYDDPGPDEVVMYACGLAAAAVA
jgi:hypothetical protein